MIRSPLGPRAVLDSGQAGQWAVLDSGQAGQWAGLDNWQGRIEDRLVSEQG